MNEIQNKLLQEYKELLEKIYRAKEYIKSNNDNFLAEQIKHMSNYAVMVKVRLGNTLVDDLINNNLEFKENGIKNQENKASV